MTTAKKDKDPGKAILELVDKLHEERKISRETIFGGIESAIQVAAERHFGVEEGVLVTIDQTTGHIIARHGEIELDPETLGRIAAQSAKQVMIQKIREAESDTVFNEFAGKKGELVVGHRHARRRRHRDRLARQERSDPAAQRADSRRNAPRRRARQGRRFSTSASRAIASRSCCRGATRTSCGRCSRKKSPRSTTAPSTSAPSPARPATAPRSPSRAST